MIVMEEAMGRNLAAFFSLLVVPATALGEMPQPEDFALWLERTGDSDTVLAVGSWNVVEGSEGVCGWSLGICHNPEEARIGGCAGWCLREPTATLCPSVRIPDDVMTCGYLGRPPDFLSVCVYENGIIQGVCPNILGMAHIPATDRFELLEITYERIAERAVVDFCDTVGDPAIETVIVQLGLSFSPAVQEGLVLSGPAPPPFCRGDANADGTFNLADAVCTFAYLLGRANHPCKSRVRLCLDAADANDDGVINVADAIYTLQYLFVNGPSLPMPFNVCGPDGTGDELRCRQFEPCR